MSKTYKDKKGYARFRGSKKSVHRAVASKKIGRPLRKHEVVHHQDGNKMNFRKKNLSVMSRSYHSKIHKKMRSSKPKKKKKNDFMINFVYNYSN